MITDLPRVTFMGSPGFAVPSLRALHEAGYPIVQVVTQPDRPAGRGGRLRQPPVKVAALEWNIPVFQPSAVKRGDVWAAIREPGPNIIVVAAYGRILPPEILTIPSRGIVNVHASLLPRWRGPSPVAAAILSGDEHSGATIIEVEPRMDAGPIVASAANRIRPGETAGELEARLSELGAGTLVDSLPRWYRGDLKAAPQDESLATYCHLLAKDDGFLRESMSVTEAERAVRAYNPWPGAFVLYEGTRLAIWRARVDVSCDADAPGTTRLIDRAPAVAFRDGWLILEEVQRAGSRRVDGRSFVNGLRGALAPGVTLA